MSGFVTQTSTDDAAASIVSAQHGVQSSNVITASPDAGERAAGVQERPTTTTLGEDPSAGGENTEGEPQYQSVGEGGEVATAATAVEEEEGDDSVAGEEENEEEEEDEEAEDEDEEAMYNEFLEELEEQRNVVVQLYVTWSKLSKSRPADDEEVIQARALYDDAVAELKEFSELYDVRIPCSGGYLQRRQTLKRFLGVLRPEYVSIAALCPFFIVPQLCAARFPTTGETESDPILHICAAT